MVEKTQEQGGKTGYVSEIQEHWARGNKPGKVG